jgi:hypothetical protein
MVNANRFIRMGAIPLVLVAYAIFIWIDQANHSRYRDRDAKVHLQNAKNRRSVEGLVFGGSNAVYSLSAGDLSYHTGLSWYNASLYDELGSINKYKSFVRELSSRIDRTKVRYVAYSSTFPYEDGKIDEAKRERGEGIKPSLSVFQNIVQFIRQVSRRSQHNSPGDIVPEQQRDSFGDIIFETVKCEITGNIWNIRHEREDEDTSANFLADAAIFYASVFPNASILIVLPSEYYGVASFDDSIFDQNLRTKLYGVLRQKYHFEGMVKIIFQPPYSSITQVCDNGVHADEDGRTWRTENLIESIHAVGRSRTGSLRRTVGGETPQK